MTSVSPSFLYFIYIVFCYSSMKGLYNNQDFFSLDQLQDGRHNKVIWVYIVSQFMQPLIHRYNQDINSETADIESYCPVAGEALLFLLLENNYDYWEAEWKWKNKSNEATRESISMATQKYTKGTKGGNGRSFGGWNYSAMIRFNEYVDIIEEVNKNEEQVQAYNKALKKACVELKKEKASKNKSTRKRKSGNMETDNMQLKFSLPPGMKKASV